MKLPPNFMRSKKICFLCAGIIEGDDWGYMQYKHADGQSKEKICKLCVKRLDDDEVKLDEQSV
jgi:hypothetical protein